MKNLMRILPYFAEEGNVRSLARKKLEDDSVLELRENRYLFSGIIVRGYDVVLHSQGKTWKLISRESEARRLSSYDCLRVMKEIGSVDDFKILRKQGTEGIRKLLE